ncbi:MAG: hypothetical protein AAFX92_14995 [Pseudomonadota bacterium]
MARTMVDFADPHNAPGRSGKKETRRNGGFKVTEKVKNGYFRVSTVKHPHSHGAVTPVTCGQIFHHMPLARIHVAVMTLTANTLPCR